MFKQMTCLMVCVFCLQSLVAHANPLKDIFDQATAASARGDFQGAINLYEKTLELYPSFAPAYNFLGLAHKENGTDLKEVAWLFQRAVEIDPNYADAYDNLSKTHYALGDFDKAEQYALKAVELNPALVTAQLSLGWIYLLGKSEPRNAIEYFDRVIEENPVPYAYLGLGIAYFMDDQRFRVLEMITELRRMDREDLAKELEQMIRQNRYLSSQPGAPLVMPQKTPGTLVKDIEEQSIDEKYDGDIQVKLRGDLNTFDRQPAITPSQSTLVPDNRPTAVERIRSLRERGAGQNKGSGY